ncbi:NAD(P)/FAD-dependent oxidoreductase [Micromonospora okii]|uniref:NAD(P)/FAD-dependent oxidoreductase n=1 Tax=Micromonospora okii TaxID=1182970 RepID=UPI001E490F18|nr:FAD-dependent oxidoreductase [Micromonospora okii]
MNVVVVGAGAIGTCTAYRLARQGAAVTLVDAQDPGRSLSAHSFAWVNAVDDGSTPYFALSRESLAAHRRLADEVPGRQWYRPTGNLAWAGSPEGAGSLLAAAESYRSKGYPAEVLTGPQARALEPALRLDDRAGPVVLYPEDAHLHPDRFLAEVQAAGRRQGVRLVLGDAAVAVEDRTVRLASGVRLRGDVVVCCAGRGTGPLLASAGHAVPLVEPDDPAVTTRGLLVRTSPVPGDATVRRVLHAPGLSVRPHHGRRLVLHSHDVDHTLPADVPTAAEAVLGRLAAVVPAAAGVTVESAFVGVRPMPVDGHSVVGWLPGSDRLYVVVTHSGVTLAPVLAEIVTREVTGARHELAEAFRPHRFAPADGPLSG